MVAWLAATAAACGGKVVVDGGIGDGNVGGGNGEGGSNAGGGGNGNGEGGFGMSCMLPPNPATLSVCGGSAGGGECQTDLCDDQGNTYSAVCNAQDSTCVCYLNGLDKCSCVLNGGNVCGGAEHCCPWGK
jgi:hypothetical protein